MPKVGINRNCELLGVGDIRESESNGRHINQTGGVDVSVVYALLTSEFIRNLVAIEGRFGGVKAVGGEKTVVGVILIFVSYTTCS